MYKRQSLGYEGAPVHDAVAVAALLRPEIMESQDLYVQVETAGDFCKGATVADFNGALGKVPNAKAVSYTHLDVYKRQVLNDASHVDSISNVDHCAVLNLSLIHI